MGMYRHATQTVLLYSVFLLSLFPSIASAIECSDHSQSHPATAAEAVNGIKVGDPVCPADQQAGVDAEAGAAKQWLAQHGKAKSDCGTAAPQSFQMLDSKFAICAYKALQAYEQQVGTFTISSAYRSKEQQVCVCKPYGGPVAGKCGSAGETGANGYAVNCSGHWHQCGLAIDVNPADGNYDKLHAFVKGKGVDFPIAGDAPHMMPAGGNCSGGAQGGMVGSGIGGAQTPTSGFTDALRSYMSPQAAATPTQNPLPASSQPYTTAQPSTIASPASGGTTGSTGVSTNPGTAANTSAYTTAVPATIANTPASVSTQLNAGSQNAGTSTYDLLSALAGNTPQATTTATGTPLALNSSLYQVQQLTQTSVTQQYDAAGNPITLNAGTMNDVSRLGQGQQTFTSQDLQYSKTDTYVPASGTTLAQRTLESLKQALLKLLDVLRPFSYVRPHIDLEAEGE